MFVDMFVSGTYSFNTQNVETPLICSHMFVDSLSTHNIYSLTLAAIVNNTYSSTLAEIINTVTAHIRVDLHGPRK